MFDSSSVRILLVESEPVLAELASFRLELLGYRIDMVGTGSQAIEKVRTDPPDLLIVDSTLRDGDGLEWLARLRTEFKAETLPVMVFSLDPSLETVERAFYAGAQDYLITPFDPVTLENKIVQLASVICTASPRRSKRCDP
ncbi:response regulator [Novipirellula artificiosorum]|uniref:Putative transcriptional regulatory protein TcrX n=1 Tax=Novipirellula artificiosorum TaxID=2528016 RepID=A0A5C6DZ26_9BACT|nr:response regulator [Novipirellula artificiosorum]TWU40661.1 putative transcriptional regulatory protein TcrX [Novipirellula artificiosorum]